MAEKTIYLQDILKDSDYQQSQFNMVQIAEFENRIIVKTDRSGKDIPNHFHGAIALGVDVGATLAVALNNDAIALKNDAQYNDTSAQNDTMFVRNNRATARVAPTIAAASTVGAYKSLVTNKCLEIYKLIS